MVAQYVPYWQINSFDVGKGTGAGAGADVLGTPLLNDVGMIVNTAEELGVLVGLRDEVGDEVITVILLGE